LTLAPNRQQEKKATLNLPALIERTAKGMMAIYCREVIFVRRRDDWARD
jgi:hypothetical protein